MENEKRLIDANALVKVIMFEHSCIMQDPEISNQMKWRESVCYQRSMRAIEKAPIVDAVEVVRCKDCKWSEYGKDYEPYCNHWKSGLYANIKDDDFCSYGERKDDE